MDLSHVTASVEVGQHSRPGLDSWPNETREGVTSEKAASTIIRTVA